MRRTRVVPPASGEPGPQRVEMCVVCSQGQLLGRIDGKLEAVLEAQRQHGEKFDSLDTRLRNVENRSAIAGAAAALMVTLGIDLVRLKLKG